MKQQQEFTNRTVRDLKDQLSRLTIESAQQEQLTQAVRVDRDRLIREQQAKVINSCEDESDKECSPLDIIHQDNIGLNLMLLYIIV